MVLNTNNLVISRTKTTHEACPLTFLLVESSLAKNDEFKISDNERALT